MKINFREMETGEKVTVDEPYGSLQCRSHSTAPAIQCITTLDNEITVHVSEIPVITKTKIGGIFFMYNRSKEDRFYISDDEIIVHDPEMDLIKS